MFVPGGPPPFSMMRAASTGSAEVDGIMKNRFSGKAEALPGESPSIEHVRSH
jgi:hypothetical protein